MGDRPMDRREFFNLCARAGALSLVPGVLSGQLVDGLGSAAQAVGSVSNEPARYWVALGGEVTKCKLCPRGCEINPGERGFCGVRENRNGKYVTKVYGKPAQVLNDAIEKGPFFHYLPATRTLGLGTAGLPELGVRPGSPRVDQQQEPPTEQSSGPGEEGRPQEHHLHVFGAGGCH